MQNIQYTLTFVFSLIFTAGAQGLTTQQLREQIKYGVQPNSRYYNSKRIPQNYQNQNDQYDANGNRYPQTSQNYQYGNHDYPQHYNSTNQQWTQERISSNPMVISVVLSDPRYYGDYCTRTNQRNMTRNIVSWPGNFSDTMQWFNNDLSHYQEWYADYARSLSQLPYTIENARLYWEDTLTLNYTQNNLVSINVSDAFKDYLGISGHQLTIHSTKAHNSALYYYSGDQKNSALNFMVDQGSLSGNASEIISGFISRVIESRYNPTTQAFEVCWEGIAFRSNMVFFDQPS